MAKVFFDLAGSILEKPKNKTVVTGKYNDPY